jgi:hypothetical protein
LEKWNLNEARSIGKGFAHNSAFLGLLIIHLVLKALD